MAQSKSKARSRKGASARSEKKPQIKKLTWRGLNLELPAEFPEKAYAQYMFDSATQDPSAPPAVLRFITQILGEEQRLAVRDALTSVDDVADIMDKVLGEYGMTLGESPASSGS